MNLSMKAHLAIAAIIAVRATIALPAPLRSTDAAEAVDGSPPNVLFIAIDDLNSCLGALSEEPGNFLQTVYPDPTKRAAAARRLTPNLDQLARTGRCFTNATCASPLCGPSRTALLSGRPPHTTGYYQHRRSFRTYDSLRSIVTLPQYLKEHGYYTAGVGKIFHRSSPNGRGELSDASDWPDIRHSWDVWVSRPTGAQRGGRLLPPLSRRVKLMQFGRSALLKEKTSDWLNARLIADVLHTGDGTIHDAFLDRESAISLPAGRPFFLACGIFRPHLPFFAPAEYFDRFPVSEMALDEDLLDEMIADADDLPPAGRRWTHLENEHFHSLMTHTAEVAGESAKIDAWRQCVQAYLACVAYADACASQLLEALEQGPYRDNTMVVLWSDHGYFLGQKHRLAKQSLWRQATNCVLMIRTPTGQTLPGEFCGRPVSLSDLYPTIVSMAGLPRPEHVDGADLTPLVAEPAARWNRQATLATYMRGNPAVLSDQFRFIRHANGDQELYDQKADSLERHNLAGQSEFDRIVEQLLMHLPDQDAASD